MCSIPATSVPLDSAFPISTAPISQYLHTGHAAHGAPNAQLCPRLAQTADLQRGWLIRGQTTTTVSLLVWHSKFCRWDNTQGGAKDAFIVFQGPGPGSQRTRNGHTRAEKQDVAILERLPDSNDSITSVQVYRPPSSQASPTCPLTCRVASFALGLPPCLAASDVRNDNHFTKHAAL